jgi:heparanase 1
MSKTWRNIVVVLVVLILGAYIFRTTLVRAIYRSNIVGFAAEIIYPASPQFPPPTGRPEKIKVHTDVIIADVDERYLSFAIDASQVSGGHWWSRTAEIEGGLGKTRTHKFDFSRPRLHLLAKELAPAYLRIGGSESDVLYYDMGDDPLQKPPEPYDLVFTRKMWDDIHTFAQEVGYTVFFTVNAGPGTRDDKKDWKVENTTKLLEYTREKNYQVPVWELGNEINVFWFQYGDHNRITGKQYAKDFARFKQLVKSYFPKASVAGPSSFYWPLMGEPLGFRYGVFEDFMKNAGAIVDIVTWHFYPQQSRRCGFALRRAKPNLLLNPSYLDEVKKWAEINEKGRNKFAPEAQVWFGEVGNAQCGGEPGVSNTYVGSLWWLDLLGLIAQRGQKVIIRQTLCDSHYALIDDATLKPNPDYWGSVLWKRLMDARVFRVTSSRDNAYVRGYAHCLKDKCGSIVVLLLNISETQKADIIIDGIDNLDAALVYEMSAPDLYGKEILLNGKTLQLKDDTFPDLSGKSLKLEHGQIITLQPATYAFIEFPDASAPACQCNQ